MTPAFTPLTQHSVSRQLYFSSSDVPITASTRHLTTTDTSSRDRASLISQNPTHWEGVRYSSVGLPSGPFTPSLRSATERPEEGFIAEDRAANGTGPVSASNFLMPSTSEKRTVLSAESTTLSGRVGTSASGVSSSTRPLVQHRDGGVALVPAEPPSEELPPAYGDQWDKQQRQ